MLRISEGFTSSDMPTPAVHGISIDNRHFSSGV